MKRILSVAVALMATMVLTAQSSKLSTTTQYKKVVWESYNISLEVPANFDITRNDAFWLEGSNGLFQIAFSAYVNASHDEEDAAWKAYDGLSFTEKKQTRSEAMQNGAMDGWEIIGSGIKSGNAKVFIAKGMKDPYNSNLYYGTISYSTTGDNRASSYIAIDISNSFNISSDNQTTGNDEEESVDDEASEGMAGYTWSTYNTKFEVPDYTTLETNTSEHFETSDGDLDINLHPLKGYSYTASSLANDHLNSLGMTSVNITSEKDYSPNDYKGYYLIGNAYKANKKVVFIVAGITDPKSDNNFKLDITYPATASKVSEYATHATTTLFSFDRMEEGTSSDSEYSNDEEEEYTSSGGYEVVEWADKDFTFQYPDNFNVLQNDGSGFKGNDGTFYMEIKHLKGFSYTPQDLAQEIYDGMTNVSEKENQADRNFSRNDNNGWEIIGSGIKNEADIIYYIIGLTDFTSDNNYQITMYFYNRSGTGDQYVDKVSTVAKSFGKLE